MKLRDDEVVVPVIVWDETNYERTHAAFDDEMPKTFAAWQELHADLLRGIPAGARIVPIKADPDEVAEWCRRQGYKVTTENRARYAVERFRRENGIK